MAFISISDVSILLLFFVLISPPSRAATSAAGYLTNDRIPLSWGTNMTLFGAAAVKNGVISLTDSTAHPSAGRAVYSRPIRFLEASSRNPASFSSLFTFVIFLSPTAGDGLAFFITSSPELPPGSSGAGHFGLFPASSGQDPATFAVEFDTSYDFSLRDINNNHVALDVGNILSIAAADAAVAKIDLKAGIPITAWIDYIHVEKSLKVWLSYSKFRPQIPILVANVDLSHFFREFMYVGFSSSDFLGNAQHYVLKWGFRTFGFSSPSSSTPAAGGCPWCLDGGPDGPIVSAPFEPLGNSRRKKAAIVLFVAVPCILLLLLAMGAAAYHFLPCWANAEEDDDEENNSGVCGCCTRGISDPPAPLASNAPAVVATPQCVPPRISLDEIMTASKGFHESKMLGAGGSGAVYEGVLASGGRVAVKRFNRVESFTNTFTIELATVQGSYRHRNLVDLKYWCCEKHELLLIYEYMPNGSLDKLLHLPTPAQAATLSWDRRLDILLGLASAIAFLHEECEKKIIHRDIKTSNVMLDADFTAKLGNFGLAELNDHSRKPFAAQPAGTMGYLAPEYVHSGVPTEKSDIYSFGVVILEVLTGRRPIDKGVVLLDWVWQMWGRKKLADAGDPRLAAGFRSEDLARVLRVGLCCAHPDSKQRPSIRKAIKMLKGTAPVPALPAKKPAIRLVSRMPESSSLEISGATRPGSGDASWRATPSGSCSAHAVVGEHKHY
ncbi:L-type lectin-domain containing receptor kinase S.6 [Apostasia shenzhenica]|uniref:non-specific serine/threonine protein kinase n=1 Tax=Apostasia shenzhenica TaxID=1088818 RepID=A0A2I0A213_9ASPA|nr:L-type lectin-domain containing receptor kinase S.6 [Apostasia shenzhenica]